MTIQQKTYDFEKDLEVGKKYERLFATHLQHQPNAEVTMWDTYCNVYDILVTYNQPLGLPKSVSFEIKRDFVFENTKNILVELWNDVTTKKKGWFWHCKADWLVVFVNEVEYYAIPMFDLSMHFTANFHKYACKDIKQTNGWITRNYVCPLAQLNADGCRIEWGNATKEVGPKW